MIKNIPYWTMIFKVEHPRKENNQKHKAIKRILMNMRLILIEKASYHNLERIFYVNKENID